MPLRLFFALAIGIWLGSAFSLTFVVTPTAHDAFETRDARRLLRPLFPRHYTLGIVCGFVALLAVLIARDALPPEEKLRLIAPTAIALGCTIVGRQFVLPQLREMDGENPRFGWLHQLSAMLNTTTLGALVLAMAAAVMR